MRTVLIKPHGFMGDCLFASSVARKLKEADMFDVVDFAVGIRQAEEVLRFNPYIDNIITTIQTTTSPLFNINIDGYDEQIQLNPTTKDVPPPTQFQRECNIPENQIDSKFALYTDPDLDEEVALTYQDDYIAMMSISTWREKAFRFSPEQYVAGIDVPYLGYGGALRYIEGIVNLLQAQNNIVEVGLPSHLKTIQISPEPSFAYRGIMADVSIIKRAKFFIGTEGGLANIASGVRTPSILTGDFIHQLYGWNGVLKRIVNPHLGPRFYWPEDGHIDLSPYLTDLEVANEMASIINGNKTAKDYDYGWCYPTKVEAQIQV